MSDLTPITREEKLLDGEDLTPITRKEKFIRRIYDNTQVIPEPITREEKFLKKAGEGGGGGFPYYEYATAINDTIVVRRSVDIVNDRVEVHTLWFFNGFTKEASDVPVPSNLADYLPVKQSPTSVVMTSAYDTEASESQVGWIGFLYPATADVAIRSWDESTASLLGGTFWAVLDVDAVDGTQQVREWFDPYDV